MNYSYIFMEVHISHNGCLLCFGDNKGYDQQYDLKVKDQGQICRTKSVLRLAMQSFISFLEECINIYI